MSDPFHIEGPAMISFSGGRTSGYMLRRILDAHKDKLPDDVHVLFANTGKERIETLDFVQDCAAHWNVHVRWLERPAGGGFREVRPCEADQRGAAFEQIITERGYPPGPMARFCTVELKTLVMHKFMHAQGYEDYSNIVGLRADEPRRVARMRAKSSHIRRDNVMPLASAGVCLADVTTFWNAQPFDLRLRPWEGNCDVCFLKGRSKLDRIAHDRPDSLNWWIEQERRTGKVFRPDAPSYARLAEVNRRQMRLPIAEPDACDPTDLGDCVCTD